VDILLDPVDTLVLGETINGNTLTSVMKKDNYSQASEDLLGSTMVNLLARIALVVLPRLHGLKRLVRKRGEITSKEAAAAIASWPKVAWLPC
jgi:hypothetical protein